MSKVLVFHPGVQHSWQTACALQDLGRLELFATSLFYQPNAWPYRLERLPGPIGRKLAAEFSRLRGPALDPALVRTGGISEWLERLTGRAGLRDWQRRLDRWGNARFVEVIRRDIASSREFAVWGYSNSARTSFELARRHGRTCILDRTIGDPRAYNRTMQVLIEQYAEWFLPGQAMIDPATIANESAEHALADRILVGCEFAASTVREHAETAEIAGKVEVLEYCFDADNFAGVPAPRPLSPDRPLRFLFLGLAIPRKGIQHVLEAISQIPASQASLTVVGQCGIPAAMMARYQDRITYRPTVPRSEVAAIMAEHDVFLFPSHFEGAGIVLYEALAAGIGLIQSDRAALAATSDTGHILPEVTTEALLEAMLSAIHDRDKVQHWRAHAQTAASRYQFAGYRQRIADLLDRLAI